jgi:predicted PurR-regulated permease PerM
MGTLYLGTMAIRARLVKNETGEIPIAAWVLDFALVLGVGQFGLQGMLLGPLTVAVAAVVWDGLVRAQNSPVRSMSPRH